jgi:CxxC motif-containing protein (DUF1111 family)
MSRRSRSTRSVPLGRRSARVALGSVVCLWLAACESRDARVTGPLAPDSAGASFGASPLAANFGDPLVHLPAAELARFDSGKTEFVAAETVVPDGLGPVFNESACVSCHLGPGSAVGGTINRLETRFGRISGGTFDPLAGLGGSLLQDHAIGLVADGFTFVPEVVSPEANVVAQRITTPLFGLGLVDAVPDEELLQLARLEAATSPATAGTPSMTTEIRTGLTRVGRFGWKAQNPTLHQFAGDAYVNEMGITNPEFPDENCPQGDCGLLVHNPVPTLNDDGTGVKRFTDFMTLLAPPPRGGLSLQALQGSGIFARIGCANCHTPALVTGYSPVAALSRKVFQPFSDFLLHDMGSLGDGIGQGSAAGRQMRTAPLWGVRVRTRLLHDGRATSLDAAILAHDGQGKRARDGFAALTATTRRALLAFLNSL